MYHFLAFSLFLEGMNSSLSDLFQIDVLQIIVINAVNIIKLGPLGIIPSFKVISFMLL